MRQLRASKGDVAFEKEWNQKFAWFTGSKECDKITTIHGEKDSLTVCNLAWVGEACTNLQCVLWMFL